MEETTTGWRKQILDRNCKRRPFRYPRKPNQMLGRNCARRTDMPLSSVANGSGSTRTRGDRGQEEEEEEKEEEEEEDKEKKVRSQDYIPCRPLPSLSFAILHSLPISCHHAPK